MHPLSAQIRQENRDLGASIHLRENEAGHAEDVQGFADMDCVDCKRLLLREVPAMKGTLYAFDDLRPVAQRDDAEIVRACEVVLAHAVNGEVWPDTVPVAGGLLGAALARLKAQGRMMRSETEHRPSRKKGAGSRRVYLWRVV